MASIFKRGPDKKKKNAPYFISYQDHDGKRRTVRGMTDKGLTEQLAAKLENEALLRRRGVIDPNDERLAGEKRRPIEELLTAYEAALSRRANTRKHVGLTMSRVRTVITGASVNSPGDLDAERIERFLAAYQSKEDLGNRTYNHYVQAIDGFARWLVSTRRLTTNPLVGLARLNTEVDVRHKRRALSVDEVSKLIESAEKSDKRVQGYDGTLRAKAYLFSYLTGLRRREMAHLLPGDFDLEQEQPVLTLEAKNSKHRRKDVLPLHPELVQMLREWLPTLGRDEPLFPRFDRKKTWLMVKKDLERIDIPYVTKDGVADFHAAGRHSHVTGLFRGGASVAEARKLARHSDVRMTMRYTHVDMADQTKALAGLAAPAQRMRSDFRCASGQPLAEDDAACHDGDGEGEGGSPLETGVSGSACQEMAEGDEPCSSPPKRWRRRESNPRPATYPGKLLRV